jgi:hypothetical protein
MRSKLVVGVALLVVGVCTATHAGTISKKFAWQNEQWIPVGLSSEGITVKEVRFEVEGGIHWNPLRAGRGPQAFVQVKNESDHAMRLALAVALFDADGSLIAATESGHIGVLDPGEDDEIKMTFREVKRRFFDAKNGEIVLETYK